MIILRTNAKLPRKIALTFYRFLMVFNAAECESSSVGGFSPAHAIELLDCESFNF
jgi:hypothetical protein